MCVSGGVPLIKGPFMAGSCYTLLSQSHTESCLYASWASGDPEIVAPSAATGRVEKAACDKRERSVQVSSPVYRVFRFCSLE